MITVCIYMYISTFCCWMTYFLAATSKWLFIVKTDLIVSCSVNNYKNYTWLNEGVFSFKHVILKFVNHFITVVINILSKSSYLEESWLYMYSIWNSFIRKYNSTFYVGMGQIQNGHLDFHIRYESISMITTAKWDKTLTHKKPLLESIVKTFQEFCYPVL